MIEAMGMDKKTIEGEMNYVLTKGFGDVRTKQKVKMIVAEEIESFYKAYGLRIPIRKMSISLAACYLRLSP